MGISLYRCCKCPSHMFAPRLKRRGYSCQVPYDHAPRRRWPLFRARELLQGILDNTVEHIDFLETPLGLLGKVGIQNYLQNQMGGLA